MKRLVFAFVLLLLGCSHVMAQNLTEAEAHEIVVNGYLHSLSNMKEHQCAEARAELE